MKLWLGVEYLGKRKNEKLYNSMAIEKPSRVMPRAVSFR